MSPNVRACVAYVAARLTSGRDATAIYDHSRSCHVLISGDVSPAEVSVYDYDRHCHFAGSGDGAGGFTIYDYGQRHHVALSITGGDFSGYDYRSGRHFQGSVSDSMVTLYDYEDSAFHHFSA